MFERETENLRYDSPFLICAVLRFSESCREICLRGEQRMFRIIYRHKRCSFLVSSLYVDETLFLLLLSLYSVIYGRTEVEAETPILWPSDVKN